WGLTGFQWNTPISWAAWIMGLAQIPFIINFFWSIKHGKKVNDNPWEATTLEWTAPSPPPHGNFVITPVAYRGPYEYSLPGREKDFTMQNEPSNRLSDRGERSSQSWCINEWKFRTRYPLDLTPVCGTRKSASGCFSRPK